MTVYFDSSFLIALYLPESSSAAARALVEQMDQPILLNELQEFEFKNSIRQKVVRREITEAELARSLRVFEDDCVVGKIRRKSVLWTTVYATAEKLSRRRATKQICRSFDPLHIAIAIISKVKRFATLDEDQLMVARALGLTVLELPEH